MTQVDPILGNRGVVHVPTPHSRNTVRDLVSFGVSRKAIAAYLKIQTTTLNKNYPDELDSGLVHSNMMVAKKLYEKALEGDTTCMLFWLKTRGRWVEPEKAQVKPAQDSILEMLQGMRGGKPARKYVDSGITIDQDGDAPFIDEYGKNDDEGGMPGEVDWSSESGEIK